MEQKVSYLGYTISKEGTHTDPKKIEKILSWPTPTTLEDLRSFLGLCGYYRRYIKNYASIANPLENLCKGIWNKKAKANIESSIEFKPEHDEAFKKLKDALTTAPILSFPNDEGTFILDTDASHEAIGSVLSQVQNGKERVLSYGSKKLSQTQKKYCITRKELYAVYYFVNHFKHYLLGRKFIVRTDHRALCWMLNWRDPNTSQYCSWKENLEIYDMDVQFRPGIQHLNADALSRLPSCEQCEIKHLDPKKKRNVKIIPGPRNNELYCRRMISYEVELKQEDDENLKTIITLLKKGKLNEPEPTQIKKLNSEGKLLWRLRSNLRFRGDLLHFVDHNGNYRLLVPSKDRNELVKMVHERFAHVGIRKSLRLLADSYYWPNMDFEVRMAIGSCKECLERKSLPTKPHLQGNLHTGYPFEKISVDVTGPLPASRDGKRYLLGIIDNFSRYPVLVPLRSATAISIAKVIYTRWISIFGVPQVIHSDRGTEFENSLILELCQLLGVRKSRSSPYYPKGDSMIERLFRNTKDMIYTTAKSTGKEWVDVIPTVEMALRSCVHEITKLTPYEVLFGMKMTTPFSRIGKREQKCTNEYVRKLQNEIHAIQTKVRKSQRFYESEEEVAFKVGDKVYAKILPKQKGIDKPRYEGPYVITRIKGNWCYVLKHCITGSITERNYYHLKTCRIPCPLESKTTRIKTRQTSIQTGTDASIKEHPSNITVSIRRYPRRERYAPKRYGLQAI